MDFEQQLAIIKNKVELKEFIDGLEDGTKALILTMPPDGSEEWYKYREFGELTLAEVVFLCQAFEHYILNVSARQ